jgi:tetraacyldisaccharide 4'-kinase
MGETMLQEKFKAVSLHWRRWWQEKRWWSAPVFWYQRCQCPSENGFSWWQIITWLLWPLSLLYCGAVALRRAAYRHHWLPSYAFHVPVIVVGNISVGGTGKTPLVIWLAQLLSRRGYKVGVVSRGYGSANSSANTADVQQVTAKSRAAEVGDEALLLYQNLGKHCTIVIGSDRVAAVQQLLAVAHCNVVISDDGLQHYALERSFEIAVIDSARNFGNGYCLPAGPLREMPARLLQVNWVVKTVAANMERDDVISNVVDEASIEEQLLQSYGTGVREVGRTSPVEYAMRLVPECFCSVKDPHNKIPVRAFLEQHPQISAIAGIGNPQRFFQQLRQLGFNVVNERAYPDHYPYSAADIENCCKAGLGAAVAASTTATLATLMPPIPLVMTEKDAVKCREFGGAAAAGGNGNVSVSSDTWWYLQVVPELVVPTTSVGGIGREK